MPLRTIFSLDPPGVPLLAWLPPHPPRESLKGPYKALKGPYKALKGPYKALKEPYKAL